MNEVSEVSVLEHDEKCKVVGRGYVRNE